MSNIRWTPVFNTQLQSTYVLDIVTGSGDTQMVLTVAWPGWDGSALTQADADAVAAALRSAVDALSDVTSSVLTTVSITGNLYLNPFAVLSFDSGDYAAFQFQLSLPTGWGDGNFSLAMLVAASPADEKLTAADLATVTAALVTFFESLHTVTACTVTQLAATPDTV